MSGETQTNIGDAIYKFVGHKISKIRWCPSRNQLNPPNQFITGSWDDEINHVGLWSVSNLHTPVTDEKDDDIASEPELLMKEAHKGSITDIRFLDADNFVVASSCGNVSLYQHSSDRESFSVAKVWESIHQFSDGEESACTALAVNEDSIVTVGEDGCINILQLEAKEPKAQFKNADGTTITGVCFTRASEVGTINSIGQMKIWDLRQHSLSPTRVLCLSGEKAPLSAIDRHPDQAHILTTGSVNGNIGFWDLRQEKFPVTLVEAHTNSVWEAKFHRLYPDNLFTCSEDGALWYWDGSTMVNKVPEFMSQSNRIKNPFPASGVPGLKSVPSHSVWLSFDVNKNKMETYSLIPSNKRPINSFDIESKTLICSTDSEALILVQNIPVR